MKTLLRGTRVARLTVREWELRQDYQNKPGPESVLETVNPHSEGS